MPSVVTHSYVEMNNLNAFLLILGIKLKLNN